VSSRPFGESYSDAYDALYRGKDYRAECDFLETALARHATGTHRRLLDLGCGTGGHAIELGRRGYSVTGIDVSPSMLEIARAKVRADPPRDGQVEFVLGDIESVQLGMTFDAAIMMFAVLGYLNDSGKLTRTLRNVRQQLRHGGIFVADFWYGPAVLKSPPGDRVRVVEEEGHTIVRVTRAALNSLQQIATINFTLLDFSEPGGLRKSNETHLMRYFFAQELTLICELAGLQVRALCVFPSINDEPSESTWNAAVIAEAI
jgi:SAM-dependent methyltransferase